MIMKLYPYPPPASPATKVAPSPAVAPLPAAPVTLAPTHTPTPIPSLYDLQLANHQLLQQLVHRISASPLVLATSSGDVQALTALLPSLLLLTAQPPASKDQEIPSVPSVSLPPPPALLPPVHKAVAAVANTSTTIRTLVLGDKSRLRFTEAQVPDPPALTFTSNIARLNRMWDDTSSHWGKESVLSILGHPIALVYWPQVYKYWKGDQWKGTKGKWFEWKVGYGDVRLRFHLPTDPLFPGPYPPLSQRDARGILGRLLLSQRKVFLLLSDRHPPFRRTRGSRSGIDRESQDGVR